MSNWACLPTSLSEKQEVFGEFNQCVAFDFVSQHIATGVSSLANLLPSPSNSKTLNSEHEVYIYLDDLEKTQPDLCILAFTNGSPEMNGKLPLPISGGLFEHIIQVFNLSTTFLTVLNTGLAMYTSTVTVTKGEDGREWEIAQFVIQQNRAYSAFSIAMAYGFQTRKTRVLIFGADSSSLSELFASLRSTSPQAYGPMAVSAAAMELQAQGFTMTITNYQGRIHAIETATGMRQFNFPHEGNGTDTQDWKSLDLISVTRDLSSFLSRFAFLKMQAETGAYLVQQMARTTESFTGRIDKSQTELETENQRDIISKLEHIESWYLGIAARCRYLSERTTAQSQTVYCLIASKDTSTNIEIARASRDIAEENHRESEAMRTIAELSRRDSKLMVQVAKDSRTVAVAAAQDSASMQVIAAVTILFLPATFTATFFSMTFFDFSDAEKPRISPWSWIYVLITVILTVVIQLAWAVISRRKGAKIIQGTTIL
ncbi:putative Mg2+ transporter-like zinc transport protein [Cladorrhinum sp. PSN332]|nr:putative Mg2+ transporter-like zinc transport protein [Cladorrhinum sp. PSN332]